MILGVVRRGGRGKEMIQEDRCFQNGGEEKINRIQSVDECVWKREKTEREREANGLKRSKRGE